jgi:hypothetical protein
VREPTMYEREREKKLTTVSVNNSAKCSQFFSRDNKTIGNFVNSLMSSELREKNYEKAKNMVLKINECV